MARVLQHGKHQNKSRNQIHTSKVGAEMRESWPTDTLSFRDPAFFLCNSHCPNAAAMASVTGSGRLTGSPSTPGTATPRISLGRRTMKHSVSQHETIPKHTL